MREYWEDLYKNIESGNAPKWCILNLQCSGAVNSSLAYALGNEIGPVPMQHIRGPLSPEVLFEVYRGLKSNCGGAKGKAASVTKLRGF
jgi:hypothetical protein